MRKFDAMTNADESAPFGRVTVRDTRNYDIPITPTNIIKTQPTVRQVVSQWIKPSPSRTIISETHFSENVAVDIEERFSKMESLSNIDDRVFPHPHVETSRIRLRAHNTIERSILHLAWDVVPDIISSPIGSHIAEHVSPSYLLFGDNDYNLHKSQMSINTNSVSTRFSSAKLTVSTSVQFSNESIANVSKLSEIDDAVNVRVSTNSYIGRIDHTVSSQTSSFYNRSIKPTHSSSVWPGEPSGSESIVRSFMFADSNVSSASVNEADDAIVNISDHIHILSESRNDILLSMPTVFDFETSKPGFTIDQSHVIASNRHYQIRIPDLFSISSTAHPNQMHESLTSISQYPSFTAGALVSNRMDSVNSNLSDDHILTLVSVHDVLLPTEILSNVVKASEYTQESMTSAIQPTITFQEPSVEPSDNSSVLSSGVVFHSKGNIRIVEDTTTPALLSLAEDGNVTMSSTPMYSPGKPTWSSDLLSQTQAIRGSSIREVLNIDVALTENPHATGTSTPYLFSKKSRDSPLTYTSLHQSSFMADESSDEKRIVAASRVENSPSLKRNTNGIARQISQLTQFTVVRYSNPSTFMSSDIVSGSSEKTSMVYSDTNTWKTEPSPHRMETNLVHPITTVSLKATTAISSSNILEVLGTTNIVSSSSQLELASVMLKDIQHDTSENVRTTNSDQVQVSIHRASVSDEEMVSDSYEQVTPSFVSSAEMVGTSTTEKIDASSSSSPSLMTSNKSESDHKSNSDKIITMVASSATEWKTSLLDQPVVDLMTSHITPQRSHRVEPTSLVALSSVLGSSLEVDDSAAVTAPIQIQSTKLSNKTTPFSLSNSESTTDSTSGYGDLQQPTHVGDDDTPRDIGENYALILFCYWENYSCVNQMCSK